MAIHVRSVRFGLLVLLGALAVAGCGSSGDDDDDDDGSSGSDGSGGSGATGGGGSGGSSQPGSGLPATLPEDEAECASATGADECFFEACCAELVACDENAACAKTFGCYRDCPSSDSDCFATCAGSALADGAEDFSTALSCALLSGCSGSQPGTGGTGGTGGSGGSSGSAGSDVGPLGSATDELGWDLTVSDEPLTADLTLDVDRAVSEEVTLDGGTVTATAEDGTVFELTIPEGALYGPTVITLTPLVSFEVASLEGAAYGVQIEPDGLELMASPTLELTPPDGVEWPVDQQLALATSGEDSTVSLALLDPESEPLRLALTHFSSYAVLLAEKGLDSTLSQSDIRNRFGGAAEERIQSAAAERLGKARIESLLGVSEGDLEVTGILELFAEYEEHVLKPRLAKAGESCAAGKLAMTTLLGVERQKSLLGFEEGTAARFIDLIPTVAEVCIREEYEICRDEHIITRALPALFGYMRQSQLLGLGQEIDGVSISPPWLIQAEEYVKKCLQFELQFDSDVAYADDDATLSMSETVTARVPFGLTASLTVLPPDAIPPGAAPIGALILGGPAPLESTAYSVHTNEPCRTIDAENRENGEFYVSFMGYTPAENSPSTVGGSTEITDLGISIAISPNLSTYDFTQQREEESGCSDVTATGSEVLSWSSTLGSHLLSNVVSGENGAWISDWKPVNTEIVATKDLTLNESDGSYTSRGPVHLIVFHTPQ